MKNTKKVFAIILALVCLVCVVIPTSAVTPTRSKAAGPFGTMVGTLHPSTAEYIEWNDVLMYEAAFTTDVTTNPGSSAKVIAFVDIHYNATGEYLFRENGEYRPGWTQAGYYAELEHIEGIRGTNGKTIAAFGTHEARYTNSYVVYTTNTYNLYRDHGIIC